ncbi:MAG: ChaN family lipoprotein [Bdellovibrionaceae bacterium]|nr:ChaN family lipoprotein [Bdellovibrio sp.]
MRYQAILLFITTLATVLTLKAQIYEGNSLQETNLASLVESVIPATIVLLGESHGLQAHQNQHLEILKALKAKGLKVSVGLEFLNYPDQMFLDQYRSGELAETSFLEIVKWNSIPFDFYRDQINFPNILQGEFSLALNLPRTISSKISKQGLESLTDDERALLPPNFTLGRDSYKARFAAAAGAHCPSLERCFAAQSAWDDTMAYQAVKFIEAHPEQVLVIIVGEFHVQYGGGLAYRIHARNIMVPVRSVSQIWAEDLTDVDLQKELQPSIEEGPRADYVWVSK